MIDPSEGEKPKAPAGTFWTLKNLRDASIGLLFIVVAVRLAFATTTIDLSGFNFTDLLSLILAISAVALSAAFYFKADESARSFYNNTYHFTKEVSEILGRIEAGFGQQLAHLNEKQAGLNEKMDRIPYDPSFIREQEAAKQAEIEEQEAKRDNILDDLMRRAQLDGQEKAALQAQLDALSSELENSKSQLAYFQSQEAPKEFEKYGFTDDGLKWLYESVLSSFPKRTISSPGMITLRFKRLVEDGGVPENIITHFSKVGLLKDGNLTRAGVSFIRSVLELYRNMPA
ncbi:hypothetical protein [Pseudomonas sp. NPDC096925]|uniref:hypothetical protein n=1 Tax=Pseudomonas sp. NPDC096925 TaxID=3364484 RepID=UPI00383A6CEB